MSSTDTIKRGATTRDTILDTYELVEQIAGIRADLQSLTSTVGRIANKQLGRAQRQGDGDREPGRRRDQAEPAICSGDRRGRRLSVRHLYTALDRDGCRRRARPAGRRCDWSRPRAGTFISMLPLSLCCEDLIDTPFGIHHGLALCIVKKGISPKDGKVWT